MKRQQKMQNVQVPVGTPSITKTTDVFIKGNRHKKRKDITSHDKLIQRGTAISESSKRLTDKDRWTPQLLIATEVQAQRLPQN